MTKAEHDWKVHQILTEVEKLTGTPIVKMKTRTRSHAVIFARQGAMWLLRKHTQMTLSQIGDIFGGYDHSTVIHALNAVDYAPVHDNAFKWLSKVNLSAIEPHAIDEDWGVLEHSL